MLAGKRETMCPNHLAPQGDRASDAAEKWSPCVVSAGTHDSAVARETNLERHQWVQQPYVQVNAQKEQKQGPKEMSARPHSPPCHERQPGHEETQPRSDRQMHTRKYSLALQRKEILTPNSDNPQGHRAQCVTALL